MSLRCSSAASVVPVIPLDANHPGAGTTVIDGAVKEAWDIWGPWEKSLVTDHVLFRFVGGVLEIIL